VVVDTPSAPSVQRSSRASTQDRNPRRWVAPGYYNMDIQGCFRIQHDRGPRPSDSSPSVYWICKFHLLRIDHG
jgi:hypothetical protein